MTTAHRPTFDPARGREALRGPAFHQRLQPAHMQLKFRRAGQGGDADSSRDLRAELLEAEKIHYAKKHGGVLPPSGADEDDDNVSAVDEPSSGVKRHIDGSPDRSDKNEEEEDPAAKRRRILEESRDIDADSSGGSDSEEDSEDDSDDDSDAELQRELERVRREKAERAKKAELERQREEDEAREREIARGNPLLNKTDFSMKRRWDDDVVFRNQARGTEDKGKKEFVNDMLRSDFHKRFMSRYVR